MKRIVIYIVAGGLLFFAGYQTANILNKKRFQMEAYESVAEALTSDADTPSEEEAAAEAMNGTPLAADSVAGTDHTGASVAWAHLAREGFTTVARVSATGCRPCVDALTSALKQMATSNPSRKVALLIKNLPARDVYVLSKEFGPQFKLVLADKLPTDFGDGSTPYMFQLTDGRVADAFVCSYGDAARTANHVASL